MEDGVDALRVLIAHEDPNELGGLAAVVESLGHVVVAQEVDIVAVGPATAQTHPDIALVELGASSAHALDLIRNIVREAACPVIALLSGADERFVREAARVGVFAYIVRTSPEELQSAIELTLHRFGEFSEVRGALGRRSIIEQAKGILMERHGIDEEAAFERLRERSQRSGRKVADLAAAMADSHGL